MSIYCGRTLQYNVWRQSFRNPNLVYVLNKFNYIENYATGLKKTLAAYEPYSFRPKYESTEHFFVVTLPNVNWTGEEEDETVSETVSETVNETVNDTVSETVRQVLSCIRANNGVTTKGIGEVIGKSRATVARALAELKAKGYIERVGSDKSGYWKVLK